MIVLDAHLQEDAARFLQSCLNEHTTALSSNVAIEGVCGIKNFFCSDDEYLTLKQSLRGVSSYELHEDRSEYGDYQTNPQLAEAVIDRLLLRQDDCEYLLEPTCGKGNFIIPSLKKFRSLKEVWAIEIHKPYVWQCKFSILSCYLQNPHLNRPVINVIHQDVFDYDFSCVKNKVSDGILYIVGNPPWVTNSMLGAINSKNLPTKSNFKKQKGLDAITGKGNFDIAEYIMYSLLRNFDKTQGCLALLIKNSVVKNMVFEQQKNRFSISEMEEQTIDAKKEFSVSVDASLFSCRLNTPPSFQCIITDFYNPTSQRTFGWTNDCFVSCIEASRSTTQIDGKCQFVWRQGIKHDCTKVMELVCEDGAYKNQLGECVKIEDDLVFGLLKSSDLKTKTSPNSRKYTILTQTQIGQDTSYLRDYPLTYKYLTSHKDYFDRRKSSIYKDKPPFSIFGVGDYSFEPYKIAISGLYKTYHFTLVLPNRNKSVMLDDTCYFIGFSKIEEAAFIHSLLNDEIVAQFLQSITFPDAKRMITKEVLMRIDVVKLMKFIDIDKVVRVSEKLLDELGQPAKIKAHEILERLKSTSPQQLMLF